MKLGFREEDQTMRSILFVLGSMLVICLIRFILRITNIPVPLRLFVLVGGIVVGILSSIFHQFHMYSGVVHMKPQTLELMFLPLLMFKTAFGMDAHIFTRSWGQIMVLAIPGLLINTCISGLLMMVIIGRKWDYAMAFLFGAVCSTIDPLEIIASLKEIGQAKYVSVLLEGEGLLSDASVMILVEILSGIITENITTWYHVLLIFCRFALGGIALGLIQGKILCFIIGLTYNDVCQTLMVTLLTTYLTYFIGAELLYVSAVVATVTIGIMVGSERQSLSPEVETCLIYFWEVLAFLANSMVFLFGGAVAAEQYWKYLSLYDCILVLITYVVTIFSRSFEYFAMAPIVTRLGYGLGLRVMAVAVWGNLRGPVAFCLSLRMFYRKDALHQIGKDLVVHVTGLSFLSLLINATSTPLLLRMLGLSELSIAKKANMNNCLRHLQNRRDRTIAMLKMDRFLADANWPLVNSATILKHPYKINLSDSDEEEDSYLGYRTTTCPDCLKEIPNDPTAKEMLEMTKEARLRILKAKRISYARQYESGMLSKEAFRVLSQAVEVAMDTDAGLIELEGLHKYFKREGFLHIIRRKILSVFFTKSESSIVKPPRKYWRRICYHIIMHSGFDFFIYTAIVLNLIPIIVEMVTTPPSTSTAAYWLKAINTLFFLIYLLEFLLKIYGYSWIYVWEHGFKTYFKSYWNMFDFIVLLVCFVDVVFDYIDLFSTTYNKYDGKTSQITAITKLFRVFRLIRLLRLCKAWYPNFVKYCDSKIDKHLAFAYDVGKGYVTGEEEVSDMLVQMIDSKSIREDCRLRMEADRLSVTKQLGIVQKDRPWIAITVKTKQAIRSTLNAMSEAVVELKVSGWVDDAEYVMLMESLEERLKFVRRKIQFVEPSPPKVMFKEVPWMADEDNIADFLYDNVATKVFDQGDVVCSNGKIAEGIYIIVTGLFKLTYVPTKEVLNNLYENGALPVVDYMTSTRFDEKVEDYIVSGNSIGELSVLTGRPYNCTIVADTASQAYILTHDIIKQAFQRSTDPITGLESRMWKSISVRLATSILMDTPAYQSSTLEKIRYLLERAFIPNLLSYKVLGVNDMIEDIILLEGVILDYNTRDCYTAPCYIPRTVQKIVLPKSSRMEIKPQADTKLIILPAKDVDEFDLMAKEEEISEMVSTASMRCLQHSVQNKTKHKKRKKRQTAFSVKVRHAESKISGSYSVYSRSRTTASSESELQNINMTEGDGGSQEKRLSNKAMKRASSVRSLSKRGRADSMLDGERKSISKTVSSRATMLQPGVEHEAVKLLRENAENLFPSDRRRSQRGSGTRKPPDEVESIEREQNVHNLNDMFTATSKSYPKKHSETNPPIGANEGQGSRRSSKSENPEVEKGKAANFELISEKKPNQNGKKVLTDARESILKIKAEEGRSIDTNDLIEAVQTKPRGVRKLSGEGGIKREIKRTSINEDANQVAIISDDNTSRSTKEDSSGTTSTQQQEAKKEAKKAAAAQKLFKSNTKSDDPADMMDEVDRWYRRDHRASIERQRQMQESRTSQTENGVDQAEK